MKMFLTSMLALVFTMGTAFAEYGLQGRSNTIKYDGTVDSNALEQRYIDVINNSGGTLDIGTAVVLDTSVDDGASVTTSVTTGLSPLCLMAVSCLDNKLCRCQTYGYMAAAKFDSSNASSVAGKRFFMSSTNAGYISARSPELVTEVEGGIFYDAASVSGSVEVFINL